MKYVLDITNTKVKNALQDLGLEPQQLLIRDLSDFEGPTKLKELRYTHYTEKLEKIVQLIKNHISSISSSPSRKVFLTSRQSSNPESIERVREMHRHYLSLHIQEETKKRDQMSKTILKLKRKKSLEKKIREEQETKKKKDEQKREIVEERRKILNTPVRFKDRNRTSSPKVDKDKEPFASSRVSFKVTQSIDMEDISAKLQLINEKIDRHEERHKIALKEKTEKIANHTQKIGLLRSTADSAKDQNSFNRVQNFVTKLNGAENRREKFRNEYQEKIKKQQEKLQDRHFKIKHNQEEVEKSEKMRVKIIEEKMNRTLENIKSKNKEMRFERELKFEKNKLKEEDNLENIARIKRAELMKKMKIIEKHAGIDKKLEIMKEEKNKINEKKREHAYQTVLEKIKLKDLKLLVERTSDTKKMSKILNFFYESPSSSEPQELLQVI